MMEDQDFYSFVQKVNRSTGIDLSLYKEQQMRRRLTSLRNQRGYETFQQYYKAMMLDKSLMDEFLKKITINVSEFWRNAARWEVLKNRFLPEMLANHKQIKCWSAACSSGEEPYTLAMILAEQKALSRSELIASDLDEQILQIAVEGRYIERSLREVPEQFLKHYFIKKEDGTFQVVDALKQAVRFERKNLLLDPFEDNFDLIICRNVIIYFTDQAKQTLYLKFSKALKPGGILFVGSTEQIFSPEKYGFETADTFFYRKTV